MNEGAEMLVTVFQSEFCDGSASNSPYYVSVFRSNTKYTQAYKRDFNLNVNVILKGMYRYIWDVLCQGQTLLVQ